MIAQKLDHTNAVVAHGGIVRMDTTLARVYLVFSGHEFSDGGEAIRTTLRQRDIRASFFFTGDFYRNTVTASLIRGLRDDGHFLGAHSDAHLLYADWVRRDSTLVSRRQFDQDLDANEREMVRFGISRHNRRVFLPPYEWYNDSIAAWCAARGTEIVTFTPGTRSNGDYTVPSMGQGYVSSDEILARIWASAPGGGLNGHILLIHIGTDPGRTDKLYGRLGEIIDFLRRSGYTFGSFE